MAADVKYVVRTRREDGHTTVQSVGTDREEAELLADFGDVPLHRRDTGGDRPDGRG